ncbi:MAG: hypothetical protein ACREJC_02020 [Tepidisphaeraceae bacterium]
MLPQHDDLEFDADVVSILSEGETRLPGPVFAWGRQLLAQQLIRGDGEAHGVFAMNYGRSKWTVTIRQEPWGGHKLIFREIGGCKDRLPFYTVHKPSEVPTGFFGFFRDGINEEIDPLNGRPRPVVDPATVKKTKFYRLPPNLRGAIPNVQQYKPGINLRTASMYTGQMREAVQCVHQRGSDSPFGSAHALTHGIVEAPHPRVVGATTAEENANKALRKFWVVEISPSGVYATRVKNTKHCCDSWLPKWAVEDDEGNFTFTLLKDKFLEAGQTVVTQLLTGAAIAAAYAGRKSLTGMFVGVDVDEPVADWTGWAFSYSGHQAQNVVFKLDTPYTYASRYRIDFTAIAGPTPSISASFVTVEQDIKLGSGVVGFPLGYIVDRFYYEFFAAVDNPTESHDAPWYVFYDGDVERVLRFSDEPESVTGTSAVAPTEQSDPGTNGVADVTRTRTVSVSGVFSLDNSIDTHNETNFGPNGPSTFGVEEIGEDNSFATLALVPMLDREALFFIYGHADTLSTVTYSLAYGTTTPRIDEVEVFEDNSTLDLNLVGRSEYILSGNIASVSVDEGGLYFMGAGLYYDDPTMTPPPDKTTKLLLTNDIDPLPFATLETLFPADTVVPSGFDKPDIYPGGWVGRI